MTELRPRILVADDDAAFRLAMSKALGRLRFQVEEASSGEEAVAALRAGRSDVALLDLQLGDLDGLEVLRRAKGSPTRVIVVTGHGTIAAAVEAMRLGAVNFVQKPVDAPALLPLLEDAAAIRPEAPEAATTDAAALGMAGSSAALEKIRGRIRKAAPTDETVLVTGESGAGKELIARALHQESTRASGPFVAINCAQAHRDLFDAELFGYVRGAFTGASQDRPGLFREAAGGSLFLDEVGELPLTAQAKLLRVLETRTVRPVGGTREVPIDVRVIAATNRDLAAEVRSGAFREDLFFRLNVLSIEVVPLRERREDIEPIARHLLGRMRKEGGRELALDPDALAELLRYDWPGNVRELANVLKRSAIFAQGATIPADEVREAIGASIFGHPEARAAREAPPPREAHEADSDLTLADLEKRHILDTFERMGENVTRTAQALGIDRRTLQRKLKSFGRETADEG
ncbi:sigma-54-dependent transcriptional regulator [Vulgatibacter incomptus]|uniref:Two component, sigma54 specific, transcriptional regulator, Fis family n=1 Tax=Vulgatibacter incomptus TaxID=1391653 RepID=A0A0K1PDC8_9BACT|nr:sigma-54 dependent transcriptional regulator [Vulgatibacter incomptus]AKU91124.1 two component, sigma54 specific, transcriptional regulator, Fis family [Vulgatibacter incomptus]